MLGLSLLNEKLLVDLKFCLSYWAGTAWFFIVCVFINMTLAKAIMQV